jgi:hypothetical protein
MTNRKLIFISLIIAFVSSSCVNSKSNSIKNPSNKEVRIGTQIWSIENLNVDKFRNGDSIPQAISEKDWVSAGENKQPAWCYYDNNLNNGVK